MISKAFRRTLKLYQVNATRLAVGFWQKLLLQAERPLACQRGCCDCCYQPLTMTLFDGILVYQWLAAKNLWTRSLKERFEETAERTTNLALEIWMLGMIPCPLLEGTECVAYGGRPFICRIAFSHDSYYCHPHRFVEALKAATYAPRKESLTTLAMLEKDLLQKYRFPRVVLPFAAAVLHGEAVCTTKDSYLDRVQLCWLKQLKGD